MKKAIPPLLTLSVLLLLFGCGRNRDNEWEQITPTEEPTHMADTTAAKLTTQNQTAAIADTVTAKTEKAKKTATTRTVTVTAATQKQTEAVFATTAKATVKTTAKATASATRTTEETATVFSAQHEISEVLRLTNNYRRAVLAPDLTLDADLCRAAAIRAQECAEIQDIDHTRPNGRGCETVLEDLSIEYAVMGENLAMGQTTGEEVAKQWRDSAGHYRNMVNRKYNKIGIGLAADENGIGYWVQIFSD